MFGEKPRGRCQEPTEGCSFPRREPERRAGGGGEMPLCRVAGAPPERAPTRTSPQRRDHTGVIHNRTGHSFQAGCRQRETKSRRRPPWLRVRLADGGSARNGELTEHSPLIFVSLSFPFGSPQAATVEKSLWGGGCFQLRSGVQRKPAYRSATEYVLMNAVHGDVWSPVGRWGASLETPAPCFP